MTCPGPRQGQNLRVRAPHVAVSTCPDPGSVFKMHFPRGRQLMPSTIHGTHLRVGTPGGGSGPGPLSLGAGLAPTPARTPGPAGQARVVSGFPRVWGLNVAPAASLRPPPFAPPRPSAHPVPESWGRQGEAWASGRLSCSAQDGLSLQGRSKHAPGTPQARRRGRAAGRGVIVVT